MTTALVFGAFDGLHPGHGHFLATAAQHADRLVVCLAKDEVIERLKGRAPLHTFEDRKSALLLLPFVDEVIEGDAGEGEYGVVRSVKPDVIVFGYDQAALKIDCQQWLAEHDLSPEIIVLDAHEPEHYKSSLLRASQTV